MIPENTDVLNDPRWLALNGGAGLQCSCGERHAEMFPIHLLKPIGWPGPDDYQPDEALKTDGDFLSFQYAVREGKYFCLRMILPLPIKGAPQQALVLSVWCAVNKVDFEAYVANQKAGTLNDKARAPARLVNNLATYPTTVNIMGIAAQNPQDLPLFLSAMDQEGFSNDHPLFVEQRQGLTLDRLFEIYTAHGHDMRSSLS